MTTILVPRPFTNLPPPEQVHKGYKLIGQASQVQQLAALGYDATRWGTPKRALIRPRFYRERFEGWPHAAAAVMGYAGDIIWEPVFEECEFVGIDSLNDQDEVKWGMHPFGLMSARFTRCHFHDIENEHGLYAHGMWGDTLLEECVFEKMGAQALQNSERWKHKGGSETFDPRILGYPGVITLRKCYVVNCGKPLNGRVSECLSFFGTQTDAGTGPIPKSATGIRIEGGFIGYRTSGGGAALFQGRPFVEMVPAPDGAVGQILYLETGSKGAKPLLDIQDCQRVLINGWQIDGGKIDVRNTPAGMLSVNAKGGAILRTGTGSYQTVKYKTIGTLDAIGAVTL